MSKEESLYHESGRSLKDAVESQMFGKPCYKISGKAFMAFFQQSLVVKLEGETHQKALALEGAQLFDPSGKGRAMKEWVQVPFAHSSQWKKLAGSAYEYVKANN